ncbi:FUSC family protein [Pseudonocardia alaniniphila]|uniref:Aromatic acid exporter family protein n=1 Tax=Pseudonocardia alaniniphila TaxID=75291 RepID=A0ABS9TRB5_9PSEU|nr:FUSC family protein [Pseudonocardia alaniniphila]MCH6171061.1 aromatic acid exporter family protein [Pseudonocardia alaniniphila]
MTEPWRSARWIGAPRRLADKAVRRVRESGRSALARAARLTGAAVAAFVAAQLLGMRDPPPLIAALTALIVVQVTLTSTLISSVQRVLSVVVGVGLALLFVSVVGLTWWSLGAIVSVSIIVGQLLRLGPQLIEVPISAMLVLAVGYSAGAENAAVDRTLETLIGSAVGVLVNILFPPAVKVRSAASAVLRLAEEIAEVLERSAEEMESSLSVDVAGRWLEDARRLNRHVQRVDGALEHVEESRQLNVRAALDTRPSAPALRGGLDVLERCAVTIRGLFRSAYDTARTVESEPDRADPDRVDADRVDAEARRLYADLLRGLAGVVRGFGRLICAESTGQGPHQKENELAAALQRLHACRSRAAERLLVDPGKDRVIWDLTSAFTLAVDRMLAELDVVEHARLREERRRAAARRRTARAMGRLRDTSRQLADRPRTKRNTGSASRGSQAAPD